MAIYRLGPMQWDTSETAVINGQTVTVPFWRGPVGTRSLIDFRSEAQQAAAGPTAAGFGLFVMDDAAPNPGAAYRSYGNDLLATVNATGRNAWRTNLQIAQAFNGSRLSDMIGETLTTLSDPTGGTRAKPIGITRDGFLECWAGASAYRRAFEGAGDAAWPRIQTVVREGYREVRRACLVRAAVIEAAGFPALAEWFRQKYRRYLGALLLRYRAWGMTRADLIPNDLPDEGDLPPDTDVSDDFNRADSASTLGAAWQAGTSTTWGITSNTAYQPSASTTNINAFYLTPLSDDDHYSQAVISGFGSGEGPWGCCVRRHATTATVSYYYAGPRRLAAWRKMKAVTGTATQLSDDATTNSSPVTCKVDINGSSLRSYRDGVEVGTAVTDTSLTANLYTGLAGSAPPSTARWDDFFATDGISPGGGGITWQMAGGMLSGGSFAGRGGFAG